MTRTVSMFVLLVEFYEQGDDECWVESASQGESDQYGLVGLRAKAHRLAREGFWLDSNRFIPPSMLAGLKIVPASEVDRGS